MTNIFNKSSRILSALGFSVLSTFCGMGVGWVATAIFAIIFKQRAERLLSECIPMVIVGGALGLIIGFVVSFRVAKLDATSCQKIEKKYVGWFGRLKIYRGAPLFVWASFVSLLGRTLTDRFGDRITIYICLGFLLMMTALSLFLYDRIPRKFIIPIGIIGWLLMVLLALRFAF
jgi:hypothetical protein